MPGETTRIPTVDVSLPNSLEFLPNIIYSNVRSIAPKLDELQAVVNVNQANIVSITETWLSSSTPDSAIKLTDFTCFRRDRPTHAGGVCICVHSSIHCRRLHDYELPSIESVWLRLRPRRLPRLVSIVLMAVVYQPTSCGTDDNRLLLQHLQSNIDSFLCQHPEGLVVITGDFNPSSTGLSVTDTKRLTGLSQIIRVLTRDSGTLDWCLTNKPSLFCPPKQLPELGSSDHYVISITPGTSTALVKNTTSTIWRRDLRQSRMREFGNWITQQNWQTVYDESLVNDKLTVFTKILSAAVDTYLPFCKIKVCFSDKP